MRPVNANADAYRDDSSKSNTHAKLAWVAYAHSDSSSESNTYTERHHSSVAYTDGDCHGYRSAQGNTKASSDSASSAVRVG
jgi:hypothetical protein